MHKRIHTIGARRDPRDEERGEEEDGTLGIRPGSAVEIRLLLATVVGACGNVGATTTAAVRDPA